MNKGIKYTIIALGIGAVVLVALYFIIGNKNEVYTITFDSDGGSSVSSQTVTKGDTVIKPTDPTKEDYAFVRWEYQNKEYDFTRPVTSNMTLKAIWGEAMVTKYDVEFTVDGKTKTLSVAKITEDELKELGFEEKSGYVLKWYLDGKEYDMSTPLTEGIKLTGKYEKIAAYTVKFNTNGAGSIASQKVNSNEKAKEPDSIKKNGFIFDGWYLNNSKYDFDTPVTKDITLVAKWSEDPSVKRYEVTFDSDGGTSVSKQRIIDGEKATEPKAPTKKDYTFVEWQLDGKKYDFKTKVTKDIKLKAKWEKIVQYTVTFDKNNGTSNDVKTVNSGQKVAKPADPTKDGHTFEMWIYDNKEFDFNTPITSNITLTARWKVIPSADTYTITATKADKMSSPDSILTVYKNGSQISVKEVKLNSGVHLCNGTKLVVTTDDIEGQATLTVVLDDGNDTEVKAALTIVR